MPRIYKGPIRRAFVKSIEVSDNITKIVEYGFSIVKEDAEFYENFLHKLISLDYDTVLPSPEEAKDVLAYDVEHNPEIARICTCLCAEEDFGYTFDREISKPALKKLKKEYKAKRDE